jgi:hypothetical protein
MVGSFKLPAIFFHGQLPQKKPPNLCQEAQLFVV